MGGAGSVQSVVEALDETDGNLSSNATGNILSGGGGLPPFGTPTKSQRRLPGLAIDYSGLLDILEPRPRILPIWRLLTHLDIDNLTRTTDARGDKKPTPALLLRETDAARDSVRTMIERRIGRAPIISGANPSADRGPELDFELGRQRQDMEAQVWDLEDQVRAHDVRGCVRNPSELAGRPTCTADPCPIYLQLRKDRDASLARLSQLLIDADDPEDDEKHGRSRSRSNDGDGGGGGSDGGGRGATRTTCSRSGEEGRGEFRDRIVMGTADLHGVIADAIVQHTFTHDPGFTRASSSSSELTSTLSTLVAMQKGQTSSLLPGSCSVCSDVAPPTPLAASRNNGTRYITTMGSDSQMIDVRKICGGGGGGGGGLC
jgi:hypothetical protein